MVKADGYGHGLVPAAHAALAGGAGWLGVAFLEEALALRRAGITAPVLSWLITPGEDLAAGVAAEVDLSASAPWAVAELAAAARDAGRPARVHLKIDTGLSRGGAPAADWPELVTAAAKAEAAGDVELIGIWSHFAYADAPGHPTIARQVAEFADAVEVARRLGRRPAAAAPGQLGGHADPAGRPLRPGPPGHRGLRPDPGARRTRHGLRPAMTLRAAGRAGQAGPRRPGRLLRARLHDRPGDRLWRWSRSGTPTGCRATRPRSARCCSAGRRRTIAGRSAWTSSSLDVGDDAVSAGDEVVLFGPGAGGEPTADDWAEATGTISYEIVTRVGARVPRAYRGRVP